jgi:phosphatidylserine/phosphatidylglycerophosphate/cardiolipin synthase-like enzyme
VLLGWDMSEAASAGVLGFAIHRTDHTEDEAYWLEGQKTFASTDPGLGMGGKVSTRQHPIQGYTWSDFSAKTAHEYTYRVVALRGTPAALVEAETVEVKIGTENPNSALHSVWFNRGAAASQEYARRFGNRKPDEVGAPAFTWLSRGLDEALLGFIARAKDTGWGLRVAAYQFTDLGVLGALQQAHDAGADVRIVYDARDPGVAKANRDAIATAGLAAPFTERTQNPSYIAHNKFMVLMQGANPVSVWTGSTNLSQGGIFGHSNVGHLVEDATLAQTYLDYWNLLSGDPEAKDLRTDVETLTPSPAPQSVPAPGTAALFSPRKGNKVLDWYAAQAASAKQLLCMTFAFGIAKTFHPAFKASFPGLRYGLLDSAGNSATAKQDVLAMRKLQWNRFAIGSHIEVNKFDRWVKEQLSGLNSHAPYIHTKFMLVDPLGNSPVVITGSANFSDASTSENDENMLVICGDKTVADIYLTEFMRLWNHYAFREWAAAQTEPDPAFKNLKEDDSWRNIYYGDTERSRQRQLFAGTLP